jgi:hypothetical protein
MDVIKFLENAGSVPMQAEEYLAAVGALDIDDAERAALMARDGDALGRLLGGRDTMYCSILAPDHEDAPLLPDEPSLPEGPDSDPDKPREN